MLHYCASWHTSVKVDEHLMNCRESFHLDWIEHCVSISQIPVNFFWYGSRLWLDSMLLSLDGCKFWEDITAFGYTLAIDDTAGSGVRDVVLDVGWGPPSPLTHLVNASACVSSNLVSTLMKSVQKYRCWCIEKKRPQKYCQYCFQYFDMKVSLILILQNYCW